MEPYSHQHFSEEFANSLKPAVLMAPQNTTSSERPNNEADINLNNIRNALPKSVFEKSLLKSLFYLAFDLAMWGGSLFLIRWFCFSVHWSQSPVWQKLVASLVYWLVSGFSMWCLFVVGHDCGHGTFSNSELVNDLFGNLIHGLILVPYFPWKISHHRHHLYHNHLEKDYSHPWYTAERLNRPQEAMARWTARNAWIRALTPFYGWPMYLYGMPDGSHFIPYSSQRLWRESSGDSMQAVKCIISTSVCVVYAGLFAWCFSFNLASFIYYYGVPLLVMGWWLTSVTFLQHHGPSTLVYDDSNWKFVSAAFETVDRTYGFGLDDLHHNITDCHVVHHLFFTKIPHYHLKEATVALRGYLCSIGREAVYRYEYTPDFALRVHQYFVSYMMTATLAGSRGATKAVEEPVVDRALNLKAEGKAKAM